MAKRATRWRKPFEDFLKHMRIDSKEIAAVDEKGSPLNLWDSQRIFVNEVAAGLEEGQHTFVCLKARQLGVSTVSLAIDIFWLLIHPGLMGALVTDTESNRNIFRVLIQRYVENLPEDLVGENFKLPRINRDFVQFPNGSRLDFIVAGTRSKSNWGESRGYVLQHLTEVAGYGDPNGLASFRETFSETHPNRLCIMESTAKGFNHWKDIWDECARDPFSKRGIFIGWWAKDLNRISRRDKRFGSYGIDPPDGQESELINAVYDRFGFQIDVEQLAWIRWRTSDQSADVSNIAQNLPWVPEQAFVFSGFSFFQTRLIARDLADMDEREDEYAFKAFRYWVGTDFFATKMEQLGQGSSPEEWELRVWEEPVKNAQYVIGCDPAFGRTDWRDRSCISIWRCYADRLVQVAEFASDKVETHQLAWILAHLASAYKNCIVNLELSGGVGKAVMRELDILRNNLRQEMYSNQLREFDWEDVLNGMRWFLYHRPDSMGAGYVYNFLCLDVETPLPTPSGWTKMGEIKEGDTLFDESGKQCSVKFVSPVMMNHDCYRLTFADGTSIVADADHIWPTIQGLKKTKDMLDGDHSIQVTQPIEMPKADLSVDPYVLGVWLGDGNSEGARIYQHENDIGNMARLIRACGYETSPIKTDRRNRTCRLTVQGLKSQLEALGLLKNKHIPKQYLRASVEQRQALLQGLMDTDGSINTKFRQCTFFSTNPTLVDGFSELLRSLGINARKFISDPVKYYYQYKHTFHFTSYPEFPVFRLSRKLARQQSDKEYHAGKTGFRPGRSRRNVIVDISPVETVPVRCIEVDSKNNLYLAGLGMVPTHNTTRDSKFDLMNRFRSAYTTRVLNVRSRPLLSEMQAVIQEGSTIEAPGREKDDRVIGAALAYYAYDDWVRGPMVSEGLTYERVRAEEAGEISSARVIVDRIVFDYFRRAEEAANADPRDSQPKYLLDRGLI